MKNWINLPRIEGVAPRQAHTDLPDQTFERELGQEGFFGPATHMLHKHPPTAWVDWAGPLRPRAFDLNKLENIDQSIWSVPALLHNSDVQISFHTFDNAMDHLVRNADGDDLLFIHDGDGEFFCDYGYMTYREGDYILIPRGTMWRIKPHKITAFLKVEASQDHYYLPEKVLLVSMPFLIQQC